MLGVNGRGIRRGMLEHHSYIVSEGRNVFIAHIELRHAQDERWSQRLRIFQEIHEPLPLCAAAFVGQIRREVAAVTIELVAGITFVAVVDFAKRTRRMESNFFARHNQILRGARRGRTLHAKESGSDSIQIGLIPVVLRHARRRIHGRGVLEFGLDVGHKIVRHPRAVELQIGGVLSANCAQVWAKIFLRIQTINQMAARAPLFEKKAMSKLDLLLCRLPELWNVSEQVGIG